MEQLAINTAGLLSDLGQIDSTQLVMALAVLPPDDLHMSSIQYGAVSRL